MVRMREEKRYHRNHVCDLKIFVEGMELFYADDVMNEEPMGVITKGKQAVIENEKTILQEVKTY